MNPALRFRRVSLLCVLILLFLISNKAEAGKPMDGRIVISEGSENEVTPVIAYNSQRQEYLVVWYNDRPGCDDIRAQRISTSGQLVGNPFYISYGCDLDRRYPDVTYNSVHDQYLVVWEQYDPNTTWYSIQGRRVDGNGALLDTSDIAIRSAGNQYTPTSPAVDYASYSDRYLVIWQEEWPTDNYILGQVMTDSGALDGSRFTVWSGFSTQRMIDIAYNRHANRYMVVWRISTISDYCIEGQQVHGGGGLYQNNFDIACEVPPVTNPVVAAIPNSPGNEKYMVAYQTWWDNQNINIIKLNEDGTLSPIDQLATSTDAETNPSIAASESSLQYYVVWRREFQGSGDSSILGQAINYNGNLSGNVSEYIGENVDYPAVEAGPAGDFLVVWQDQPLGLTNTNIYGQLWGHRIYLPIVIRR
ncbi:MAG: hypothetical protein JW908_02975 [Anaerolineales bacterium]|nr:hypothetical protein [Anaerolineales bacterium]